MSRPALLALLALVLAPLARAGDDFPPAIDTEPDKGPVMPAGQAAAGFRVPDGFRVDVFAAEPDVRNPIALAWDARGRLWVAENYTYAERQARFDLRHRDRVLIFEDADGDGHFDKRTVFADDVQPLTSVEVGRGGAWLVCPPRVLFIPDRDGDDRPDGPAEVVLDGFNVPQDNYHNFANGLRWGPDGWLYGRCGASAPGLVGVPGTPDTERIPVTGGIWRYQPASKRVEMLNHGTTNPWGHDWDALGELFFINTVCGHLWHSVPGAHLVRSHTVDPNPRAYLPIDQHADHYHWDNAKEWTDSRVVTGEHDRRGGGHAHSGMMIYGGANWPAADQGKLFTLNFHGRRANVDRLERVGGGFVGKHEPDRFFAGDARFRGIDLASGPDGTVFVLDWNDTGECHENNGVHRNSGRIFRISHGQPAAAKPVDLARADLATLVALHGHADEWFPRMARRQLADRAARGESIEAVVAPLHALAAGPGEPKPRLRALWTLFALERADDALVRGLLAADHEALRAWAIRLLTDRSPLDTATSRRPKVDPGVAPDLLPEFARLARDDSSGLVRLTLASTLQRLPAADRLALAAPLVAHAEDAADHDIPLMVWYGLIPVADVDPSGLARLAGDCALPTTRRLIARRLAEEVDRQPAAVDLILGAAAGTADPAARADLLVGLLDGLRGWRKAPKPAGWDRASAALGASADAATRDRARELGVLFGDGRALDEIRRLALDDKADLPARRAALRALIDDRPADLRATCEKLLRVRSLNATAARGLTLFDDPAVGAALVGSYRSFAPADRPALVDALVARPSFARALVEALANGAIPRGDVSAFQARQVRSLGDPALAERLASAWGEVRETPADRKALIARVKAEQPPESLARADLGRGRATFERLCASCHALYGQGGAIGPDLTGAGRDNLDYLLENILDPGAVVTADFRVSVVATHDGRVLNGLIRNPTDRTITVQGQNEAITLPRAEVDRIEPSPSSLMPEGLLDPLAPAEVRDLFGYLMHRGQVPLPAGVGTGGPGG